MQIGDSSPLPPGVVGTGYSQHLWSVAATAPVAYSITGGSVPAGLSLSNSGLISGSPTAGGTASFTVTATDSSTRQRTAVKSFTLSVTAAPVVVTQPADTTVVAGSDATFTVAFSGTPSPTIRWQVSTDGGQTFTDIPGATSPTLSVTAAAASQSGNRYRARGSNAVSSDVSSRAATLTVITPQVVTSPSAMPATNLTIPAISGSPVVGQRLTCRSGTWTNTPTSYSYRWDRDGTPIAGATDSFHTVVAGDTGTTLTCAVTATNAAGTSPSATSLGVRVPVHACPASSGSRSPMRLGLVKLGETRTQAERAYSRFSHRGRRYIDFFCLSPIGVRVGYASPMLLRDLSRPARRSFRDRVVWISTSSSYYSVDGVRPGATVRAAGKRLKLGAVFTVGLNDWYVAPAGGASAILKVRHGIVQEIGIASRRLTRTRAAQRQFLTSFD